MMSLSWLEWGLQLAVLLLLGAAIPFAIRLERALREIRKDRSAMETSAQGLSEAAAAAESAILRLRATAELAGRQVQERVTTAEPLRDDLRFLIERAETLADRLESLVRTGRPMAGHEPPPAPAATRPTREPPSDAGPLRSQAERDLLRALSIGTGKGAR
ncbi:MAG: hypothetical protein ING02_11125 [Roseomonas sp.]|nr:hypothetical protein [Roseomonas sp.]